MATLAQLKKEAEKYGAELLVDRDIGECEAWLPKGFVWQSTDARCAVVSYNYTGTGVMPSIYDDVIALMEDGVYECNPELHDM